MGFISVAVGIVAGGVDETNVGISLLNAVPTTIKGKMSLRLKPKFRGFWR
ncbi:hypothetical protein HHE02_17220 [Helicobacter heilmannii]|nr:hypothetical protein HHE014_08140 [Helicobacter heilmannii]CRF48397.1 hypothetical protein HHE02_17220 [Helicobacter heilmannii]CRF49992.1 hypothetical protein HHE03_16850 [Helicobacter heilmannii]